MKACPLKLKIAMARSLLEYSFPVLDPYSQGDIDT